MNAVTPLSLRLGMPLIESAIQAHVDGNDDDPIIRNRIEEAFAEHLLALRDAGMIVPHTATPNRRMNDIVHWNGMFGAADGTWPDPEWAVRAVAGRLSHVMVSVHLMMASFAIANGRDRLESIADAVIGIDSGSTRSAMTSMEAEDHVSGETLTLRMRDWNPVLLLRPDITHQDILNRRMPPETPAPDLEPAAMRSVLVDMPSGRGVITDWIRVDGFTDHVDEGDIYRGAGERENEAEAIRYAADHGFVSVRTASTSVDVVTDGRIHAVIRYDEDMTDVPAGFRRLGRLSFDLRQISVIDEEALRTILKRLDDDAEAVERRVREGMTDDTIAIRTVPGSHRVLHSGRGFIEDFLPEDHPLRKDGIMVVMILEPVEEVPVDVAA